MSGSWCRRRKLPTAKYCPLTLVTGAYLASIGLVVSPAAHAGDVDSWVGDTLAKQNQSKSVPGDRLDTETRYSRLGGPKADVVKPDTNSRQMTGGNITWQASSNCLSGSLRRVINDVVANFGPVTVTSTCRSASQNRAAGGADHSYHLNGEAVDFRTDGNTAAVYAHLSANGGVGGLKHYGGGLFHIDTGPRRSW